MKRGFTLDELALRTRHSRFLLADVLLEEVQAGRVDVDEYGYYRLNSDGFDRRVLLALVRLQPRDADESRPALFRLDRPSAGRLARSFS